MAKYIITKTDCSCDYNDVSSYEVTLSEDRIKEEVEMEFRSLLQSYCEDESDEEYARITEEENNSTYGLYAHIDFEMGHEYRYDISVVANKIK